MAIGRIKKISKIIIVIILLAWYGFFLIHKIDLTTADLGRHLANGKMFIQGNFGFLTANFYSYTYPGYEFICHHWGAGVIFHLILKLAGFAGVHLLFIVLSLLTFLIFFYLAVKEAGFGVATIFSLLVVPLIAERTEVRPEVFSYFFCSLFFLLLWRYRSGLLRYRFLFLLPLIEVLWVNIHIYFIFGLFLLGAFLAESLFFGDRRKNYLELCVIFLLSIIASFLNPFGLNGTLAPLNIFEDYGYRIVENQSVHFLDKLGFIDNPNLLLFKIIFFALVLSFLLVILKNRRRFSWLYFFMAMVFGAMGWLALRNFTLFGMFSLPLFAANIKVIRPNIKWQLVFCPLILFFTIINLGKNIDYRLHNLGLGLAAGNNRSADFFTSIGLEGPVFNNYDIGGYLIYQLFPAERVFVDNRPENYPASFFEQVYIPMQEHDELWKKENNIYNFNAIFFSHRDMTPWGQQFLVARIDDPAWAPVFVDNFAIIFLKRNELNRTIIKKYEIGRENFSITKTP